MQRFYSKILLAFFMIEASQLGPFTASQVKISHSSQERIKQKEYVDRHDDEPSSSFFLKEKTIKLLAISTIGVGLIVCMFFFREAGQLKQIVRRDFKEIEKLGISSIKENFRDEGIRKDLNKMFKSNMVDIKKNFKNKLSEMDINRQLNTHMRSLTFDSDSREEVYNQDPFVAALRVLECEVFEERFLELQGKNDLGRSTPYTAIIEKLLELISVRKNSKIEAANIEVYLEDADKLDIEFLANKLKKKYGK